MAGNSYWSKRLKQELMAKQASEADVDQAMSALYRVHQTNIEKEIQAFYQKYADDEGVSITEAKKRADKVDVQAFADKAKRYVEEKDFSPQANAELKLYNLKMRVSRAELLQYNMDLDLLALGEGERQLTEKFLKAGFADEVKSQSGILGEYIKNPKTVERSMEAVLNVPFEGVTWSERIWERQQALRQVVARTAHETLVRGRNAMAMIPAFRREFGVSKSAAKRLAVTEVARVQSEAQKISMTANGFDEYEYIAEPTACPICAKLDGNIYKVAEMEPGKNCAPMHPHCHCSTAPHMDRKKTWDKIDEILNEDNPFNLIEHADNVTDDWVDGRTHKVRSEEIFEYKHPSGAIFVVDNKKVVLDHNQNERYTAKWFSRLTGKRVDIVPRVNEPENVHTPDYLVDGAPFDLKAIRGSGKYVIDGNSRKADVQANNIIFDITNTPLSHDEIARQIDEVYMYGRRNLDVVVVKNGEDILAILKKK